MPRFLFLLALALVPGLALADVNLTPVGSDITVKYFLSPLFGSLLPNGIGGADPMGGVIGKFNEIVLIVGGILLAYGLVAGTMQTAHDGEMLGKRWSSMWTPLRTALGTAAIVPFGTVGYCAIQYVVMWVVMQGIGGANVVWQTYANVNNTLPQATIAQTYEKGNAIAAVVLKQQLCAVMINSEIQAAKTAASNRGDAFGADVYGQVGVNVIGSNTTGSGFFAPTCGGYSFATPSATSSTPSSQQLASWFSNTVQRANFGAAMSTAHTNAFNALQTDMQSVARDIYLLPTDQGGTSATIATKYGAAVDKYNRAIASAIQSAVGSMTNTNEVARNATQDGWGMAGAWYMKYIYMANALNAETQKYPKVVSPSETLIPAQFQAAWSAYSMSADNLMSNSKYTNQFGIQKQVKADKGNRESWLWDLFYDVLDFDGFLKTTLLDVNDKNPVLALADLGNKMFDAIIQFEFAAGMIVALSPVGGGASLLGSGVAVQVAGAAAALQFIQPVMLPIFGALIASSAVMAFYIPVLPFILWFGVVVGWLIMVVEAIIAAPMWAVSHVHPDGDGVVGRGGQGYSLLMGLALRPALAVMGLVASMELIKPVGTLFNKTYWTVFSLTHDGNSGVFMGAAAVTIFAVIYIQLVHKMFSLIHVIPDQILRWMGGPSSELGQTADKLGGRGLEHAAAVGGIMGALGSNARRGAMDAANLRANMRNNELNQGQNEELQASRIAQEQTTMLEADRKEGAGMGLAREAGIQAVKEKVAEDSANKRTGANATSSDDLAEIRDQATAQKYNKLQGNDHAWEGRKAFEQSRASMGLSEAKGIDHDRFQSYWKEASTEDKSNPQGFADRYVKSMIELQQGTASTPKVEGETPDRDKSQG